MEHLPPSPRVWLDESSVDSIAVDWHEPPPLPQVPLGAQGQLDPTQLPKVLNHAFIDPFRNCDWAQSAVSVLDRATDHYRDVFLSWRQSPELTLATIPTIHDVIEALFVLRSGAACPATLETHALLQATLNQVKMGADENRRMHQLHELYPLLTLNTASKLLVQNSDAARSAMIAGAIDASHIETKIDIGAKATDELQRLEQVEQDKQDKKDKPAGLASKKQVLLTGLISIIGTAIASVVLYETKIKSGSGGSE